MQHGVLSYFVKHRTAANVIMLLMIVLGLAAATKIRSQFLPDVVIEAITVRYEWPGAGAKDIDQSIVAIVEPKLRSTDGVDTITARSLEGIASIRMEFQTGWDMAKAMRDVTTLLDENHNLPESAEDPQIIQSRWFNRVVHIVLHGKQDIVALSKHALALKQRLFAANIVNVDMRGINEQELLIHIGQKEQVQHDISLREIANLLRNNAITVPAGDVQDAAIRIRTGNNLRTIDALNNTIIKANNGGGHLLLGDIATITWRTAQDGVIYRHNDNNAIFIEINRSQTDDVLALQKTIDATMRDFRTTLPDDVAVEMFNKRAEAIEARLDIVLKNGAYGLILVVIFLFLFLSARSALWVAAGIPVAMCATLGVMYVAGITLNMISLFGLIICLGIIVDDAIVIAEHADYLHSQGHSPHEAALQAAQRMMGPVICASLTTIIAFSALILIGGRFGQLIADIPYTVIAVLIASMIEAFLILPAHMRHAMQAHKTYWFERPSMMILAGFERFRIGPFAKFVRIILRARYIVCSVLIMILLLSVGLLIDRTVPWRFFNAPERSAINANIAMLPGATRADTQAMVARMDEALHQVNQRFAKKYGTAPVLFNLAKIGGSTGRGLQGSQNKDRDLLAGYTIILIDPDIRPYSAFAFIRAWREKITRHPLLETLAVRAERSGPGGDSIEIVLSGQDLPTLKAASLDLQAQLIEFPIISALEDTLSYDKDELTVSLTPKGAAMGFNIGQIQQDLRDKLSGIKIAEFPLDDRIATLRVQSPPFERQGDVLANGLIKGSGGWVNLSQIISVQHDSGFGSAYRKNGEAIVQVFGDIDEQAGGAAQNITTRLNNDILPNLADRYGVSAKMEGLAKQEHEFLSDALIGMIICLIGIYVCLCWVFSSWSIPIVIICIIPFGTIGAIWGHHIHDVPLSMFSIVGLIGMSGIIINDAIVLVAQVQTHLKSMSIKRALQQASCDRLRAVWLTTCTTVAGLTPMLFETSRQAQFLKPTVITLVYGLGLGMILVLIITPALLAIGFDCVKSLQSSKRFAKYLFVRKLRLKKS